MGGLGQMGVGVPIAHTAKTQTVVTSLWLILQTQEFWVQEPPIEQADSLKGTLKKKKI